MCEFDTEYEFCKECQHHGEPNGCNREGGECDAYFFFTNAYMELQEYKQLEVDGRLIKLPNMPQDINNILEPLKLKSALDSEIMKLNFRKINKTKDIDILDYTIIAALEKCLSKATLKEGEGNDN